MNRLDRFIFTVGRFIFTVGGIHPKDSSSLLHWVLSSPLRTKMLWLKCAPNLSVRRLSGNTRPDQVTSFHHKFRQLRSKNFQLLQPENILSKRTCIWQKKTGNLYLFAWLLGPSWTWNPAPVFVRIPCLPGFGWTSAQRSTFPTSVATPPTSWTKRWRFTARCAVGWIRIWMGEPKVYSNWMGIWHIFVWSWDPQFET